MARRKFKVYKHTNNSNGKVYIGITSQEPEVRWGENGEGYLNNKHFSRSIDKYGWDNFSHEILEENLGELKARHEEMRLIKEYKSNDPDYGYNKSKGGEKVPHRPHRHKRK